MISQLTQKQKEKLKEYKNKWTDIGLSTNQISREEIKNIIDNFYIHILKRKIVPIIITRSPKEAWDIVCLYNFLKFNLKRKLLKINKKYNRNEVKNEVK